MWNFCEIFSDNADKARLITALLSVIAAVLVVFLTHWFAHRRSRIELRAKKLEEIYSAITEFSNAGWTYMNKLTGPHDQSQQEMKIYHEAHNKVETLVSIYAKEIVKDIEAMNILVVATREGENKDISIFTEK
jgi:hypothetical protein